MERMSYCVSCKNDNNCNYQRSDEAEECRVSDYLSGFNVKSGLNSENLEIELCCSKIVDCVTVLQVMSGLDFTNFEIVSKMKHTVKNEMAKIQKILEERNV